MRRGQGFHDRHSPFRFDPATLFAGGAVQGAFYNPSNLGTLFQDAAGTVPVSAVGDPVGRILDLSGNGNHATQTADASRPVLGQTNGLYHLTFDGSNDSMLTGSINFTGTDKMLVVAGVTKSSDAARGMVFEFGNGGGGGTATYVTLDAPNSGTQQRFAVNAGVAQANALGASVSSPVSFVLTGISNLSTPETTLRRNGVVDATSSTNAGSGYQSQITYIGRRNNASLPFNGRLYGLIVLGAAASDWQVQVTEQWMAGKTGLQF